MLPREINFPWPEFAGCGAETPKVPEAAEINQHRLFLPFRLPYREFLSPGSAAEAGILKRRQIAACPVSEERTPRRSRQVTVTAGGLAPSAFYREC